MKRSIRLISVFLLIALLTAALASCDLIAGLIGGDGGFDGDLVDYVSELKLDMSSPTLKQEATVKAYVDGDTTHFYVPSSVSSTGVLKARYLAINTPEST